MIPPHSPKRRGVRVLRTQLVRKAFLTGLVVGIPVAGATLSFLTVVFIVIVCARRKTKRLVWSL